MLLHKQMKKMLNMRPIGYKGQPQQEFQDDLFQAREDCKGQSCFDICARNDKVLTELIERGDHIQKADPKKAMRTLIAELQDK